MRISTRSGAVLALCLLVAISACDPDSDGPSDDPNIVPTPDNLEENDAFVSPPTLNPIYACAETAVVRNFRLGAELQVFVNGALAGTEPDAELTGGQPVEVVTPFNAGDRVRAVQIADGVTSDPSNEVVVIDYHVDYPSGLPKPRIRRSPLLECGRAIGIADALPGATVTAFAENRLLDGTFAPEVQIGQVADFGYMFCPSLQNEARVSMEQSLCGDTSSRSDVEVVEPGPTSTPGPSVDPTPIDGAEIVVVWGPGGNPSPLLNGATISITEGGSPVGGQPTPGGGQQIRVNPVFDDTLSYDVGQALCDPPTTNTFTPLPCSALEAPTIYPPLPGDVRIDLIDYHPGARILVFANGAEIGDSGPSSVNLSRPIEPGETITVVQEVGDCQSSTAYQTQALCEQGRSDCVGEWPAFRQSGGREGNQPHSSKLANPFHVRRLVVEKEWRPSESLPRGFIASPIVYKGRLYVGGTNGRLYALDATNLDFQWMYPPAGQDELFSDYLSNSSSYGIASSATIGVLQSGEVELIIFGAPDRSIGAGLGSGRLFAVRDDGTQGSLVWASDELAVLDGTTRHSYDELHEQIGYSSPLVYNNRVYIGIANHGDNPIQKGKVKAVELATGATVSGFVFEAAGGGATEANGRGGGIWSSAAGGARGGVFFTTGNTRGRGQTAEPAPNHGLSFIRVDENNGNLHWKLQPVPYSLDCDPDWAAGAIIAQTACGEIALSTMKDGWAYGVRSDTSTAGGFVPAEWQFPDTGTYDPADGNYFDGSDPGCDTSDHGDVRYLVPGAAWRSTYVTMTGGEEVVEDVDRGFSRLHSLNTCSGSVRWMKDIPGVTPLSDYQLGPPTVTNGIIYVGTAQGNLMAIADPALYPSAISRCSNAGETLAACVSSGYEIVTDPILLKQISIGRGSMVRNEPVIANDRIYVSTTEGWVVMLEPEP